MSAQPLVTEIGPKIRLVRVTCPNTKTTCISVQLQMPLLKNTAELIVLASYISHSSKAFPSIARLNAKLESLYGAVYAAGAHKHGESCRLRLSMTVLNDRLTLEGEALSTDALSLLLDFLLQPNVENGIFEPKQLETEIRICTADLESSLNDKRAYALHRMIETMCKDEPYGLRNDELLAAVKKVTPESLYAAWQTLLREAVISVTAVGEQSFDEMEAMLRTRFAALPLRAPQEMTARFIESADRVREVTEEMELNQSKLVLGFRAGMKNQDDRYFAYRVMTDVFGGGPYSRLFNHVREERSLCYYCSARLDRLKGILVVQSGIEKKNKDAAFSEIMKQLKIMQDGLFTDEEFNASKAALIDIFRGVNDTAETIAAFYDGRMDGPPELPEDIIAGLRKVSRADVVDAAKSVTLDTVYFLAGKEAL